MKLLNFVVKLFQFFFISASIPEESWTRNFQSMNQFSIVDYTRSRMLREVEKW